MNCYTQIKSYFEKLLHLITETKRDRKEKKIKKFDIY